MNQPDAEEAYLNICIQSFIQVQQGAVWLDKDGYILAANPSFAASHGYQKATDLPVKTIFEINPHLSFMDWREHWRQLEENRLLELRTEHMTADRQLFPVKITGRLIKTTSSAWCLALVDDLRTAERSGEEAPVSALSPARREELYLTKFTIDHAQEMIFWIDREGQVRYVNQTVCDKLGYEREELMQLKASDFVLDLSSENRAKIWEQLRREKQAEMEAMIRTRSGSTFPAYSTINYIRYKEEEIACVFSRDWTRKKEKEFQLQSALAKVEELSQKLQQENTLLKEEINLEYNFNHIISTSPRYKKVLKQVEQVSTTDATVLIIGETGTGKELLARALHVLSNRENQPLIKVNCAALPESLIESELFGHEKGAFTGAYQQKKGRFELADQGTIFLDEVAELPLDLQTKLLRVLQEGEFERVGGTETLKVDVRVITATNRNLEEMVNQGKFREDLFYRLYVFPIHNIPLRERREDIPLLVRHFTQKYSEKTGKQIERIPEAALRKLEQYNFPGNVRELENIIERAVILSDNKTLNLDASFSLGRRQRRKKRIPEILPYEEMQRRHILKALEKTGWRVTGPQGAARLLQLNDRTLASKMRRLGIRRKDFVGK